jgi:hypothetical protein
MPWRQQHELDLQITLGRALEATKGYSAPEVAETIARARALAEGMDRPEHLVLLSLGQWRLHSLRAEHKLALPLAEQIERLGEARNDVAAQVQAVAQVRGLTLDVSSPVRHDLLDRRNVPTIAPETILARDLA